MANPENKQLPYESTQKDIRDGIDGASAKLTTTELTPRNLADVLAEEIKALTTVVGGLNFINCVVVAQLPTTGISTTTIYLVPKSPSQQDNIYDEYINLDGTVNGWEKIGDTEIDLSNYYTKTQTDTLLNGKVDTVAGMGLSHNDFTDTEKTKLSGIESGAEVNVQSDWNEADNTKDDYIKNKPSSEVKSATDTFTTVNGGLLSKCQINLVPVQSGSGDPSPDNVRPISGHTEVDLYNVGKNKFDYSNITLLNLSNSDGTFSNTNIDSRDYFAFRVETRYGGTTITQTTVQNISTAGRYNVTISINTTCDKIRIKHNGSIRDMNIDLPFSTQGTWTVSLDVVSADPSTIGGLVIKNIQIESGSTATSYEPYQGKLYQVQIGSTVYGGTVDLVSGVMNVTHKLWVTDGTETWAKGDANSYYTTSHYDFDSLAGSSDGYCNMFVYKWNFYQVNGIMAYNNRINLANTSFDTLAELTTYLSNNQLQMVYPIATPFTIQLTPQQIEALVGQNNLSTPLDGQSIDSVKYREVFAFDDVEKVVSLRVPISMLGTDESGRTTASKSYASGDYFYKDGYMCKALTSISAGATLTLNTNYSQGTLADILKAIENA